MNRFAFALSFLFCVLPTSFGGQVEDADPYSVQLVRAAIKTHSQGLIIGKVQTHLARMGDRVSIALLKGLTESELVDPNKVREFLPIIEQSFSQPQLINPQIDRDPKVTLFLLRYLEQKVSDQQARGDIQQTTKFVKEKTGSLRDNL